MSAFPDTGGHCLCRQDRSVRPQEGSRACSSSHNNTGSLREYRKPSRMMGELKLHIADVARKTGLSRATVTLLYKETAQK
ncbi:helix-turn-helix domain-containing protein [Isoalcanivorax indicus]|uniref:helix-turn-helix domain-containing protein n=1 Tax=Isoalcanivorax indicus TaxID=2202653 RepID=UPI003CCC83ED